MQMRQRDVAALDVKYTKELADVEAENDALRDDVAAGRRRLHIKAVCQSVREATTASGVDNAASPDWQRPGWTGIISTLREADHLCKQLEGTQKYIGRAVQIELPISMGNSCNYCEQYTRASSGIMFKVDETEQSIYECLLGFCFNNIFCAATNFGCIDSFLLPNSRNEEMMGDGFLGATAAGLFWNSKRLLSTSCNKQGQRSGE